MSRSNLRMQQLEGLRGIAALVVLFGHLERTFFLNGHAFVSRKFGAVADTFYTACLDGNFAVWLFWVMSAFVLSLRIHAAKSISSQSELITRAALRRYPRLAVPVFVSVFLAWTLHHLGLMSNGKLAHLLGHDYDPWLGSFYVFEPRLLEVFRSGLWQSFFAYDEFTSYNTVLWTMEIELYGSLFLFALLALIGKHPARLFIYGLTAIVACNLRLHWINAFVLGTVLSDGFVHRETLRSSITPALYSRLQQFVHSRCLAIVAIVPLFYLIGLENIYGVLHLVLATIVTAYVVIAKPGQWFFSRKISVFLGKISFGLYLVHLPIICATAFPLYTLLLSSGLASFAAAVVTSAVLIVLSIVGGWIFWWLTDRPAILLARRIADALQNGVVGFRFLNQPAPR